MQCPSCGYTHLRPQFKWCPECGSPLRAQNIPRKIEHGEHGVEPTLLQQSGASTRDNGDLELGNRLIQGKFNISLLGLFMAVKISIQYFTNSFPNGVRFDLSDFA